MIQVRLRSLRIPALVASACEGFFSCFLAVGSVLGAGLPVSAPKVIFSVSSEVDPSYYLEAPQAAPTSQNPPTQQNPPAQAPAKPNAPEQKPANPFENVPVAPEKTTPEKPAPEKPAPSGIQEA